MNSLHGDLNEECKNHMIHLHELHVHFEHMIKCAARTRTVFITLSVLRRSLLTAAQIAAVELVLQFAL